MRSDFDSDQRNAQFATLSEAIAFIADFGENSAASRKVEIPVSLVAPPQDHPPVASGRIGALLVNLGSPEGVSYWPMRRYLQEFLSDRRVIETPRALWLPLLHGIILTARPGRKGRDYAAIWNDERDEAPLKTVTRSQSEKLAARIAARGVGDGRIVVDWAMRYGKPSIPSRIEALQAQGCDRLLVLPLYPQYCAATSGTVADRAFETLKAMRWQPTLRIAAPFFDRDAYIAALADSLHEGLGKLDFEPEKIVISWHGIPKDYHEKGDPYYCHCAKTTRLLGEKSGLGEKFLMTFQSRFGPKEWLQPYTLETIGSLPSQGTKKIAVMAPGFFADCLETLEELDNENREAFLDAGGEHFALIPCLNDSERALDVLDDVLRTELAGWI